MFSNVLLHQAYRFVIYKDSIFSHFAKASLPILTQVSMVMLLRLLQLENADFSMLYPEVITSVFSVPFAIAGIADAGTLAYVTGQLLNAFDGTLISDTSIVTETSSVAFENA